MRCKRQEITQDIIRLHFCRCKAPLNLDISDIHCRKCGYVRASHFCHSQLFSQLSHPPFFNRTSHLSLASCSIPASAVPASIIGHIILPIPHLGREHWWHMSHRRLTLKSRSAAS
jgi:hypothetical protein